MTQASDSVSRYLLSIFKTVVDMLNIDKKEVNMRLFADKHGQFGLFRWIASWWHADSMRVMGLLLFALGYHAWIIGVHPSLGQRLFGNLLLGLLAYFVFFEAAERTRENVARLVIIAVFELAYPLLLQYLPGIQGFDFVKMYLATGILLLTWVYYAVFGRDSGGEGTLISIFRGVLIFFWLAVLFSYLSTWITPLNDIELSNIGIDSGFALKKIFGRAWEGVTQVLGFIWGGITGIFNLFDINRKQLTSEYYAGVVDENEKQKLGVYIQKVMPAKQEFYRDERVNVYASLETKTLEDEIDLQLSCYTGNKNRPDSIRYGTIYPDQLAISDYQNEEIDCTFQEGSLEQGSNKITVAAVYNFETIGYVKRYFTHKEALLAAKQQEIDLLDEYQIEDREPSARFTNGPVKIGIGPEEALLGISEGDTIKLRLGVTLDNNLGWNGHLKKLQQLIFLIPEEMSLDVGSCSDPSFVDYTVDDCISSHEQYRTKQEEFCQGNADCLRETCDNELEGKHAYRLDTTKNAKLYNDIESFLTVSCRMSVDDVQGLLGNTPFATHYFYVKARYDYETEKQSSVIVREETISGDKITKPKQYSSSSALLTDIYLQHYHTSSEIQDAITTHWQSTSAGISSADTNYVVMAIIAAKAKNYAAYLGRRTDGTEEKGLMHLTQAQLTLSKELLGLTAMEVFSPRQNINAGVRLLAHYDALPGTNTLDDLLAAYYSQPDALNVSTSCPGKKYTCEDSFKETRAYVDLVNNYINLLKEKDFLEKGRLEEQIHMDDYFISGNISFGNISQQKSVIQLSVDEMPLTIIVQQMTENNFRFKVETVIDNKPYTLGTIYFGSVSSFDQWIPLYGLPFLQFNISNDRKTAQYRIMRNSVVNSPNLREENIPLVIWRDVAAAVYDGNEIHLSYERDGRQKNFCEIPWGTNAIVESCNEDSIAGVTARRIERTVGIMDNNLGRGSTKVQFAYDMKKQWMAMGRRNMEVEELALEIY